MFTREALETRRTLDPMSRPIVDWLRIVAAASGVAVLLALFGWIPTRRLAGDAALGSMFTGVGICLFATVIAAAPVALGRANSPGERMTSMLTAMALRMFVTLSLFAVAALGAWVPRGPLAAWTGLSYLCLLAVETTAFLKLIRARDGLDS